LANDGPPVTGSLPDFAGSKADQIRVVRCLKASVSNSGMDEGELPIAKSRRPIASSQCRGPDFHLRRATYNCIRIGSMSEVWKRHVVLSLR
jgi:hypothetical protein